MKPVRGLHRQLHDITSYERKYIMDRSKWMERIRGIVLSPRTEWPAVAEEAVYPRDVYVPHVLVLAAIPAVAGFVKGSLIGHGALGIHVRVPVLSGLAGMLVGYVMSLALVCKRRWNVWERHMAAITVFRQAFSEPRHLQDIPRKGLLEACGPWSTHMIEQIKGMPAGTVGFRAIGKVTAEDYENVLVPDVEAVFALNGALRMLYHLGPAFEGFELGAMWDDAKPGLRHLDGWGRVAVVTDVAWVRTMVSAAGFMAPARVELFHDAEFDAAVAWIEQAGDDA